jgi:hypothetical protein
MSARGDQRKHPERRDPFDRNGIRSETDRHGDAEDDRQAEHRLDRAAEDVSGQQRGARDAHRAEAGDDAFGHVHATEIAVPCAAPATASSMIPGAT